MCIIMWSWIKYYIFISGIPEIIQLAITFAPFVDGCTLSELIKPGYHVELISFAPNALAISI